MSFKSTPVETEDAERSREETKRFRVARLVFRAQALLGKK